MSILEFYARHDSLTDPGNHGALYRELPNSPPDLRDIACNLIAHVAWLRKYGITADGGIGRETLPVATRLATIQASCPGALSTSRSPDRRSFGTCRDYALLLCSMLRHHAIAARVRCGFATYLSINPYDDHWICEYWSAGERRWMRADAQLDALHRSHLGITFDPSDIPQADFVTAAQAWQMARSGAAAADAFGHGDAKGLWFLRVNVHRDLLALTNRHTSDWDGWRQASADSNTLVPADALTVDRLARAIERFEAEGDMSALENLAAKSQVPPWQA